jgi:phage-related protein
MRRVIFYKAEGGSSPVEEFLDGLSSQAARKVAWVLKLVEELDRVPTQYLKRLVNTNGLWEVRVASAGNAYRILCFFDGKAWLVLNHAFCKKSQRTPRHAIVLAEERRRDYLRRKQP